MTPPKSSAGLPRVLVIDDEPLMCGMLARLMRRSYDITTTTDGREGLRLAAAEPWEAILCDVMMPELSGAEFLKRLRVEQASLAQRVGFMTGGAFDPKTREFLESLRPRGWLSKPFGHAEVQAFIESLRAPA
ncbi:MAG: response regulator [Myxococcota bacterium]